MTVSSIPPSLLPKQPTPERAYVTRTLAFMATYALLNVAVIFGLLEFVAARAFTWFLAIAVAATIAGQLWATLRLIADSDEYMRVIVAKRFILSAGIVMALWTGWGFCESYASAPHLQGWLIYPMFWLISAFISPFVNSSR